jgi:hypothetical protein
MKASSVSSLLQVVDKIEEKRRRGNDTAKKKEG